MTEIKANQFMSVHELSNCINGAAEALADSFQLKSTVAYWQLMGEYVGRMARAKEEGKLMVAHTTCFPTEIFYAMDLVPNYIDTYCTLVTAFQDSQLYLSIAAQQGIPPELCSLSRVANPMCHVGSFPRPDAFVYSNVACENTGKGTGVMADIYKTGNYLLDRPFKVTSPQSKAYWRKELEGAISYLENLTGRKMDYDRLKEAVRLSYQATQLGEEINDLRKAVPSPLPSEAASIIYNINNTLAGTPEAVHYLEQLRDELKDRVDKGIGAVPKERFRIIYTFVYPVWDMELMAIMEQKYGAVCVGDILNNWKGRGKWMADPADPIGNLVLKNEMLPGPYQCQGPIQDYVDDLIQMARNYQADGALCFMHQGCVHGSGAIRSYKDELSHQLGVPTCIINGDFWDKSFTTRSEVLNKLDGFFEMIEDSKKYQARRKAA